MKSFFLFLFFCISFFTTTFIFGQEYYRSNSIGMVFEKIPVFRIDDFLWVINISKTDTLEIRTVYFKGEENRRIEYLQKDNLLVISEYVSDELVRIEKQMNGLVVKEEYYKAGAVVSTFIYEWSGQQLKKTTYIDGDINIYDDLFIAGNNGSLRQIKRVFNTGEVTRSEYGYSNQEIKSEWYGTDDESSLYRYEDGKVVRIENWHDDVLVRTKTFSYNDSGRVVKESDLLTGIVVRQMFDMDDKLVSDETRDGSSIEKSTYIYENERLVEKMIASSGIRRKHLFYYFLIFVFFFALSTDNSSSYTIYKWKDKNGAIHYTDKKPDNNMDVIEIIKTKKKLPVTEKEIVILEDTIDENTAAIEEEIIQEEIRQYWRNLALNIEQKKERTLEEIYITEKKIDRLKSNIDYIEFDSTSIDQLVTRSGLTPAEVSSMLLQLEMSGYIASGPGGLYNRLK